MTTLIKPTWWDALSAYYGFSNNDEILESDNVRQTLTDYLTGHFADLLSPAFMASQHVVKNSAGDTTKPEINIAPAVTASEVIGRAGADYLAGSSADDILYGDANNDFFTPLGGNDLVIGSTSLKAEERDTISYETASQGIVVDYTALPPAPEPTPYHAYYSASYDSWAAKTILSITGFITGPGGDIINFYDLLTHVGYTGTDPVADGYLVFANISSGMKIQFDPDGAAGRTSGSSAVVLRGITVEEFSVTDNLVTSEPSPPPPPPVLPDMSDYTVVSQDGFGGTDILYSVENILGSRFDDVIHGRDDAANFLDGGVGNDSLYGEGGNDTLNGGEGHDLLDGGEGHDLFLMSAGNDTLWGRNGKDTYKFGADYLADAAAKTAFIGDFQTGPDGDKINISELLRVVHYTGTDPVADGYISIRQGDNGAHVFFDADGNNGASGETLLATLGGVDATGFSVTDNLVSTEKNIIFTGVLGQSNASSLRVFSDDSESGITRLEEGLKNQTDFDESYSVMRDKNGIYIDTAIGGSIVNGDVNSKPETTWWYPSKNTAGHLLIRATDILSTQLSDLRAKGAVTPTLVWGQGESDAYNIGSKKTDAEREAMAQTYKNATLAVFNYLIEHLGSDLQIYIMQTGYYNVAGALASGVPQSTIDATVLGLTYIREAQQELALEYPNIHLAVSYTDLPMLADLPNTTPGYEDTWAKDQWHLSYDAKEVVGDRLADFIAQDLGFDHIIDNPGPYPMNMLTDLTIHEGGGITIEGNDNDNIITGTTGDNDITGANGVDAIVTGAGNDRLEGGNGADILRGGAGADTFIFLADTAYNGSDTLQDFNITDGDKIDVQSLLSVYHTQGGDLANFIRLTEDGLGNSIISIDRDGNGTEFAFTQIALLSGTTGLPSDMNFILAGNPPPPTDAVTAQDDFFTLDEDTRIFGNLLSDNGNGTDSQSNGRTLFVQAQSFVTALGGIVLLSENGDMTYTPPADFSGSDSFTYTLYDETGAQDTATVTLTVNGVNNAPDAMDDSFTAQGGTIIGNVFADNGSGMDTDQDGDTLHVSTFGTIRSDRQGVVVLTETGEFTYIAAAGFTGSDTFHYTVQDGHGGLDSATVSILVTTEQGAYVGNGKSNIILGMSGTIYGMGGDDIITGNSSANHIYGGNGNDIVIANDGNDVITGNAGKDILYGGNGNDIICGGNVVIVGNVADKPSFFFVDEEDGVDTLYGGNGNDILIGGKGNDVIYGNSGADTFMFLSLLDGVDKIEDFKTSEGDVLDISSLLENYDPVTDAISDFIRLTQSHDDVTLSIDTNGGGDNFTKLVVLDDTGTLDLDSLINNGNLIV
ncbi:MAG: type I secretion C-terminal target domain-containing protein [Pseudobdellovibrionaceae bacterium]